MSGSGMSGSDQRAALIEKAVRNTMGNGASLKWLLDFFDPKPDSVFQFSNKKPPWQRFGDWLEQRAMYSWAGGAHCHADRIRMEFDRLSNTPSLR